MQLCVIVLCNHIYAIVLCVDIMFDVNIGRIAIYFIHIPHPYPRQARNIPLTSQKDMYMVKMVLSRDKRMVSCPLPMQ